MTIKIDLKFMGLFSNSKKISKPQLDKLLRRIDTLKPSEREYIKGLFDRLESDGISKQEIIKAIQRLKIDTADQIDRNEAESVKRELLSYLDE